MWAGLPLDEALEQARALGVTTLELCADHGQGHLDLLDLKNTAADLAPRLEGFRVAAISAAHPDMPRDETEGGAEAVNWTVRAIRAADTLGARVVVVSLGETEIEAWESTWSRALSALRLALHRTRSSAVRVAVEITTEDVLDSLKKAVRLLAEINDPRLGLTLDTATLYFRRIELREALRLTPRRVFHVQLRDATRTDHRLPFGKGQVSVPATVKALWDAHYRGVLSLELLDLERHGVTVHDAGSEVLPRLREAVAQLPGSRRKSESAGLDDGDDVDEDDADMDDVEEDAEAVDPEE